MPDGGTASTPLVERDQELAALHEALAGARAGRGRFVLVEGHAGLGKSRLLGDVVDVAESLGIEPLVAVGDRMERDFPHGITLQLYERRLARTAAEDRADLLSGAARSAAQLLDHGPAQDTFAVLRGLYWLTSNLAERQPLLLVVDDLQWADGPSLRFLAYLGQRLADLPVLVLAARRPGDAGAEPDALREVARRASRIALGTLSGAAVAEVVRARMSSADPAFCEACARVTGGNPFLLTEVLHEVAVRGLRPDADAAIAIADLTPESVLDATTMRIARLPTACLRFARAVAVFGSAAPVRQVRALAGLDLDAATDAHDALVAAAILRPGRPAAFLHPLLRAAVLAAIPFAERSRLHARAARLLHEEGAPSDAVASQLLHAPRQADPWTVERLQGAAAAAVVRGASESARDYLRRALEEPPRPDTMHAVLVALGTAEVAVGDPEARTTLTRALELVDDARTRAELLLRLGMTVMRSQGAAAAAPFYDRGLRELDDSEDDPLGEALLTGYVLTALLDPVRAQEAEQRFAALRTRPPASFTQWRPGLLATAALLRLWQGDSREAVQTLARRALGDGRLLAEQGPDSPVFWAAVHCLSSCDAYDDVFAATRAVAHDPRRRHTAPAAALLSYTRAWALLWTGRVDEAIVEAELAVRAWGDSDCMYLPIATAWLATCLLEAGDVAGATAALDLEDVRGRWGATPLLGFYLLARGRVLAADGRLAQAFEVCCEAGAHFDAALFRNPTLVPWRSEAAIAGARLDPERARALAAEEVAIARSFGAGRAIGSALRVEGLVAEVDRQVDLLAEAVDVLAATPARLEHARSLVDLGAALRRRGRRTESRDRLREALGLLEQGGARALVRRATAELNAAGGRPVTRRGTGAASLTASERRVADLASRGMTNRQIAQSLFVSVKAVEWHLSNVYRKLEITSRAELGPALGDDGVE